MDESVYLPEFTFLVLVGLFVLFFLVVGVNGAPDGVSASITSNETKTATSAYNLNISGGRIATINITATTQNPRWKGFVGQVSGTFTLDDATGSTLFDWSIASIGGEVYATRNSTTRSWSDVKCANTSLLENENSVMSHTSADDNISKTFNDTTHSEFFVGSVNISLNSCPTLNTYVNNASQDSTFQEIALSDSTNFTDGGTLIYATIIETDSTGFDNETYDFQMIVPEDGSPGFSGQTAYYLYVELS